MGTSTYARSELPEMKEGNISEMGPNPGRPKDFSLGAVQNLSGQDSARQPKVFIKTFG